MIAKEVKKVSVQRGRSKKAEEIKFDLDDILIMPADITYIDTRSEVDPTYNGFLPIITAPMDTVVDNDNIQVFLDNKINVCTPRGVRIDTIPTKGLIFESISLDRFEELSEDPVVFTDHGILVDIANGHMSRLLEVLKNFRKAHGYNIDIMLGNVANPKTYIALSKAGANYIRVGIGNGNSCLTTQSTGVGYPMGSLIKECFSLKRTIKHPANIIADGGMKTYSDVIKAIGLGADYVMLGSILNKSLESSGDFYIFGIPIPKVVGGLLYNIGVPVKKKFRGMSTKEVQRKHKKQKITTSEGVVRYRDIEYRLDDWVDNFRDYLISAMSYTNNISLFGFKNYTLFTKITENAKRRFSK
jgi:IMP dehydrogenase/GMP reductase